MSRLVRDRGCHLVMMSATPWRSALPQGFKSCEGSAREAFGSRPGEAPLRGKRCVATLHRKRRGAALRRAEQAERTGGGSEQAWRTLLAARDASRVGAGFGLGIFGWRAAPHDGNVAMAMRIALTIPGDCGVCMPRCSDPAREIALRIDEHRLARSEQAFIPGSDFASRAGPHRLVRTSADEPFPHHQT